MKVQQTYVWQARDRQNKLHSGQIEASSLAYAKAQLLQQDLIQLKIRKHNRFRCGFFNRIKARHIMEFTRELATMLKSGLSLLQSFDILLASRLEAPMHALISDLKYRILQGHSFTESLRGHPKEFDSLYCNLVYTGELSGTLDVILERLALQLEKTESLKKKIKKALFYPVMVVTVAMLVMVVMLLFVIPQFEAMFQSFGATLPAFTLAIMALSRFMQVYGGWVLVFLIVLGLTLPALARRAKAWRAFFDQLLLRLPLLGSLFHKAISARFTRTLATTIAAGIPLLEALQAVAHATGNEVYRKAILSMREEVGSGASLHHALFEAHLFKPMLIQMVAIGEASGTLDAMLSKVASIYEEEVDLTVAGLSEILEPAIIVILGVMVGALVIAIYLPIFKMATVV